VKPKVKIAREAAGMALVDGDNGMGHVVMSFAAKTAIEKAKTAGAAWVGVNRSNHADRLRSTRRCRSSTT